MSQFEIDPRLKESSLYSPDLAPVPLSGRTWTRWSLAALWVGMAVCIPTYMLAVEMIAGGMHWWEALIIIALANAIITVPMVLNGQAGVKYGIPFPVVGRAAFGTLGIHVPALMRGFVACGWFGIQTWVGGLAIYAMWHALAGTQPEAGLSYGQFIAFGVFWVINAFFVWKGTESIKVLENLSAPILIVMGILLIVWGAWKAQGFSVVLEQSVQLERHSAQLITEGGRRNLVVHPVTDREGKSKAKEARLLLPDMTGRTFDSDWQPLRAEGPTIFVLPFTVDPMVIQEGKKEATVQFRSGTVESSKLKVHPEPAPDTFGKRLWRYLTWLTVMVGFWATMSISISDITRYARTQGDQVAGQFLGLPGTMVLFSFIGIFVTCAALINFDDILAAEDAPWNPVALLARFDDPVVVIVAQLFMLIATLTTNIAANVIAPAYALSNLLPKQLDFRKGGILACLIGIVMCPWWLMNEIMPILLFISGWLGPVLGVLIADYFIVRRKTLDLNALFDPSGRYRYTAGFNPAGFGALVLGIVGATIGKWVPALDMLYSLSWFTGFLVAMLAYAMLMRMQPKGQS